MSEKEYVPFGPEWVAEMKKMSKDVLVQLLRSSFIKANKLEDFKKYVHQRLDDASIEKEPNGIHSKAGCRIGDRLDILIDRPKLGDFSKIIQALNKTIEAMQFATDLVKHVEEHGKSGKPWNECFAEDS